MKNLVAITLGLIVAAINPCLSYAAEDKEVLLTVSGLISKTNSADKKSFVFSFDDLQKVGGKSIQATTVYNGKSIYTGPLIRDILSTVGASSNAKSIILVGADDYRARVPITDIKKWDVVAAHSINGKRMIIETKGPLWAMYPLDQDPENLTYNTTAAKLVWNLVEIIVK